MSAGPGSKIRALLTPVFSLFRGLCRARPRCGVVCVRSAGVAALWQCILRGRSRGAVHGISLRGTGRVLAAPGCECGVFGWRSRNLLRFICRPGRLHGVFLPFAESVPCFLPFAESVPCFLPFAELVPRFLPFAELVPRFLPFAELVPRFLPFEESAVCVGDKFGPWPLDD